MAGLYIIIGNAERERIESAAVRLKFFEEETEIIIETGFAAAWVGHDDRMLFAPAFDPKTGVRVITAGRVAWDEPDWKRAEHMFQFEGGFSNRLLLARYLEYGAAALNRHNGSAALIVWDPREQVVHLWTDHFGYHPVFLYRPDSINGTVIATFSDAIADDTAVHTTPDHVSMAEFLSAWRITPPHTYYREIKYAGAATHFTWSLHSRNYTKETYWEPYQEEPFPDIDTAAEELASAVTHAVRIRTLPRLSPIVSYTSGGMDSRAVLFAATSPKDVIGINLYDVPNKESAISKRLCEASGVCYVGFARDNDYYPRWLTEGARISGAMWSQEDNHFLGTRELVQQYGARTVITACTTDWLFKGYGLEKKYVQLWGRNFPITTFTHDRIDGFLPNVPRSVPAEFAEEIADRLEECFSGTPKHLQSDADWLAVEDRRVRPACYAVSVSGQIMYRIFPYDTFLADVRIADCYGRCRAEWKINSELWGMAVRNICASGSDIEDANFGWRVGSSSATKLLMFGIGWIKRRFNPPQIKGSGLATDGSWPNLDWYIQHSQTLERLWNSTPVGTRDIISRCWGSNPWDTSLEDWSHSPNDLFRILSLVNLLTRKSHQKF
jgi:hypothetical protein